MPNSAPVRRPLLSVATCALLTALLSAPLAAQTAPTPIQPAASSTPNLTWKPKIPKAGSADCAAGVKMDDGTVEGGYGYMSTVTEGTFVQRFDDAKLRGKPLDQVCVCLLSNGSEKMKFDVVFFEERNGKPADTPFASVTARAKDLPQKVAESGRFYSVDVSDVTFPDGPGYVGVRWNPSTEKRTFVCLDQGSAGNLGERTPGFHRDNQSRGWEDVLTTKDWLFKYHEAALIRVLPKADKPKS